MIDREIRSVSRVNRPLIFKIASNSSLISWIGLHDSLFLISVNIYYALLFTQQIYLYVINIKRYGLYLIADTLFQHTVHGTCPRNKYKRIANRTIHKINPPPPPFDHFHDRASFLARVHVGATVKRIGGEDRLAACNPGGELSGN